jgi:hypothetical protein
MSLCLVIFGLVVTPPLGDGGAAFFCRFFLRFFETGTGYSLI